MSSLRSTRLWCGIVIASAAAIIVLWSPAIGQSGKAQSAGKDAAQRPVYLLADPGRKADALAVKDISLDQANLALQSAIQKSQQLQIYEDIAVVDAGGNLKAFARMDEAWLGSIDIAQKKAKTARFFNMETGQIGKLSQPGKPLYMIEVSNGGLITFPGGIPIKTQDGHVIGAIGASGSTVENDEAVATAGAQAVSQSGGK